ncbi:hypothetical protein [Agrobacterium pusense]|uniref:hypothetical protein n=1 Tax=Agrobacterium pusense TaxID=648995 RepID=UPI002FDE23BA
MRAKDDRGYWLGWYIAYGMAAMLLVFLVFRAFTIRDFACGKDETDCFRQWVSALGAWVAIPSIIYAAVQVTAAAKFHKQNMKVAYRPLRALADRTLFAAHDARARTIAIRARWKSNDVNEFYTEDVFETYREHFAALKEIVSNPIFEQFESVAFVDIDSIPDLHRLIEEHAPNSRFEELAGRDQRQYSMLRMHIRRMTQGILTWMTECIACCEELALEAESAAGEE